MLGKISTQFVSFLLLPVYTDKLTTAEYGVLDVYLTLASILIPILTLQIEQGIFRFLITQDEKKEVVLSTSVAYIFLVCILMTIAFIPINSFLNIANSSYLYGYYISYMIYVVVMQFARADGNNTLYSFASFFSSSLIIVLNICFLIPFNMGVEGVLLSHVIAYIATIIIVVFVLKTYKFLKICYIHFGCFKSLMAYSVPLVFNQISSWVINYSDRLIIVGILGMSANGIYALANKFFTLLTSVFNIYNIAWTEMIAKTMKDKDRNDYYNSMINLTIQIYMVICAWIIAFLGIAFKLFINESYYEAYDYIPMLVIAAVFSGLSATIGSVYIGHKKTKSIGITTMGAAVVNIIIHLLLVKPMGLYAASISTLVAFVVLFVYRIIGLKKIEPIKINISSFLLSLPLLALVWCLYATELMHMQVISVALALVFSLFLILKNKDIIMAFLSCFKKR